MSFLAPLFLAGALVVGLPIILHLIRRSTRERTVFSSLMFLHSSPPRLSRRSRLEHILLLLLRCAAVVLLALGFARPFLKRVFPETQAAGPAKKTLVLLDTSASMRRQGLWTAARDRTEKILRQASSADEVALFTFDRQLKPLLTFEEWNATSANNRVALARNRLAGAAPGWAGTRLDTALIRAAEMLAESEERLVAGPRQVVVVTDLQEGSEMRALQGHAWPKRVEVITESVASRAASNAGIQLVTDASDSEFTTETAVRVRVSNAADSRRPQFQVGWSGPDGAYVTKPVDVYVPPGQSRVVSLSPPGTNAPADRIVLTGDDEPFDNTAFVVPPGRTRTTVLYFGGDSPADNRAPLFFLDRAFQQTRRHQLRVVPHQPSAPLATDELDSATLFVVTGTLGNNQAAPLRDAVSRGKTLLFAPTSASAAPALDAILGTARLSLEEKQPANYAMLGQIEFRHPLFAPFADARFSDFTRIHFWKYRKLDPTSIPEARPLAQFDTGDPAILEIPSGKGRVILLASCWHPADSQLALSSKFVPLLYSLLEYSGAAAPAPQQYFVGSSVPLPPAVANAASPVNVLLPDRSRAELQAGMTNFADTLMPGIYSIGAGANLRRFAVNLEPAESRTVPLAADALERLGVPVPRSSPVASRETDRKVRLQNTELEARQKLWRWFILATLAVLGIETWLAGRTARLGATREENG